MAKFNSEQVARALAGRRAVGRFPFPGVDDFECGVRLLSDAEMDEVRIQAVEFCKARRADMLVDPEFLDRQIHRGIVFRAFVDPDSEAVPPARFFESLDEVRALDPVMVRTLFELYMTHQQATDPLSYMSREEVDSLVESLGKGSSAAGRLSVLDRNTLLSCALSMAHILRST